MAAAGVLAPTTVPPRSESERSRVALVFLSNSEEREIWPYPGFDCAARQPEIVKLLSGSCPQVEFVPVVVAQPGDVQKAIALKDTVDGYLVYTVTLNWGLQRRAAARSASSASRCSWPTSTWAARASFLVRLQRLCGGRASRPAACRTTRPDDLVAVARLFADVEEAGHDARLVRQAVRRGLSPHLRRRRPDEVPARTASR